MIAALTRVDTTWENNMINEHKEITVDSNFVLDMNCDTEDRKL